MVGNNSPDPLSPESLRQTAPEAPRRLLQEEDVFGLEQRITQTPGLAKALARAKLALPSIPRNKTVSVQTRGGGSYSFSYAPLDTIISAITPVLAEHGLSILQNTTTDDNGRMFVNTTIMHESGEWVTLAPIPVLVADKEVTNADGVVRMVPYTAQEFGSALTYSSRYSLRLALNLATDDDDDGNLSSGNTATTMREPAPQVPQQPGDPAILKKISACESLADMDRLWLTLTPRERVQHTAAKDVRLSQIESIERSSRK